MAIFQGTLSIDVLVGGTEDDSFEFTFGELQGSDRVRGQGGVDTLLLLGAGAFVIGGAQLADVRGIERIVTSVSATDDFTLTLTEALVSSSSFAGQPGSLFTMEVETAGGDDQVYLANLASGHVIRVSTGDGADRVTGGANSTEFYAGDGADVFVTGAGEEYFEGSVGRDSVEGAASDFDGDVLHGGSILSDDDHADPERITMTAAGTAAFGMDRFEEVVLADGTNDLTISLGVFERDILIEGGSGDDTVEIVWDERDFTYDTTVNLNFQGGGGNDTLTGASSDDMLQGGPGIDILTGGIGEDILDGGGDGDLLIGGSGDDLYLAVGAGDLIVEEEGNAGGDTMETALREVSMPLGIEILVYTGTARTTVTGNGGYNTITGGGRNDRLLGGDGWDTLTGKEGADTLKGQEGLDELSGGKGDDELYGGAGDDDIRAGGGNDLLSGGGGYDVADYTDAEHALDIDMDRNDEVLLANGDIDNLSSIELILGSAFDDVYKSNDPLAAIFEGRGGFDVADLNGVTVDFEWQELDGGTEKIIGGSGNDRLFYFQITEGGGGNDLMWTTTRLVGESFDGGEGIDEVAFFIDPLGLGITETFVDLEDNSLNTGHAEGVTLVDVENLTGSPEVEDTFYGDAADNVLNGRDGDDELVGRGGDDTLIGEGGNDQLFGMEDDDILIGGAGTFDVLDGGEGIDTADYSESAEGIVIEMAAGNGQGTGGDAVNDILLNIENIIGSEESDEIAADEFDNALTGLGNRDDLNGSGGDDVLDGGSAQDMLNGGSGRDRLTGGGAADTFKWNSTNHSRTGAERDVVVDFSLTSDIIDLSSIDAVEGGNDNAFVLTGNGGSNGFTSAGQLRFLQSNGVTVIYAETTGDGVADMEIELTGTLTLTADHFLL